MTERDAGPAAALRAARADRVVPAWQTQIVSRSSGYVLARHAAAFRTRYEEALRRPAASSASDAAARGRILSLLGRGEEASAAFDAALRMDRDCSAARAWRWSFESARTRGRLPSEDIDRAVAAEPSRALWRALRGAGRAMLYLDGTRRDARGALADLERALETDPDCLPALIAAALTRSKSRRHSTALALSARALDLDARPSFLLALSAACRLSLGDREGFVADSERAVLADEGLGYFQRAFESGPRPADARRKLETAEKFLKREPRAHWAYVYLGDHKRAPEINDFLGGLRDLEKAVELAPDRAYAWAYLSRARLTHADRVSAMAAADRAVSLAPACGWIRVWRGEIRRRLGDASGALADFDRGLELDPDYELGYAWRGGAKRALGRVEEALPDLALAGAMDPRCAWAIQEHSLALRRAGRTAQALEKLEEARRLDPKFSWCGTPDRLGAALAELDAELSRDPRNARAWAWRGESKLRAGDHRGAKADLDRAIALDPAYGWARAWRGRAWQGLGRPDRALRDFDEAVRLDPRDAHALAWRGRLRHLRGDPGRALPDLRRAAELDRKTSWLYLWKGEAARRLGLLDEAVADFDLALGIDPSHAAAMAARAGLRLELSNARGAREDLDRALACAREASGAGRHSEAEETCTVVLRVSPSDRKALAARAEARRCLGDYAGHVADLDALLRLAKDSPEAWIDRGRGRRNLGDFTGALSDAERALRLRPDEGADANILRSEALRNLGRFAEAVEAASLAARARPRDHWALVVRGKALRQSGDARGALRDFRAAAALAPGDAKSRGWAADALRKLGRRDEAADSAAEAVRLLPSCAWAWALSGEISRELGRRSEGMEQVRRAVALDPNGSCAYDFVGDDPPQVRSDPGYAWVYAWRGGVLRGKSRWAAARRDLERAAALDPACFWARAWLGELRLARGDARGALRELAAALEEHPGYVEAWTWRGRAELELGRVRASLASFRRALALDAREPWAAIGAASCLDRLGRSSEAEVLMRRARSLAPGLFASGAEARA